MNDTDLNAQLGQIDARFGKLEALIKSDGAGTRHEIKVAADEIKVQVEDLHDQIKVVAEGHSALIEHIVEVKGGIERLEAGQGRLELHVCAVESRVTRVEKIQKVALTEVRGLATKVGNLSLAHRARRI
jgi:hypothetical protein